MFVSRNHTEGKRATRDRFSVENPLDVACCFPSSHLNLLASLLASPCCADLRASCDAGARCKNRCARCKACKAISLSLDRSLDRSPAFPLCFSLPLFLSQSSHPSLPSSFSLSFSFYPFVRVSKVYYLLTRLFGSNPISLSLLFTMRRPI